jgi:hypothetical protein
MAQPWENEMNKKAGFEGFSPQPPFGYEGAAKRKKNKKINISLARGFSPGKTG